MTPDTRPRCEAVVEGRRTEVRLGDWRDVLHGTYDPATAVVTLELPA